MSKAGRNRGRQSSRNRERITRNIAASRAARERRAAALQGVPF